MIRHPKSAVNFHAVVVAALVLGGCIADHADTPGNTAVALSAPQRIRQARAVDPDQLGVEVTVNNQTYTADRQADGSYIAAVTVPANSDSRISVVWTELYAGTSLKLAEQTRVVTVGDTELTIILGDSYVTTGEGFDADDDGFSNLSERAGGTDPLSADDRPNAAAVQLTVAVPDDIVLFDENANVIATLNDEPVELQRVSAGVATATVDGLSSDQEIVFDVLISSSGLALASGQKSTVLTSGDNNVIAMVQTDFDTSADEDNDGIDNLRELLRGTDPRSLVDYQVQRVITAPGVDGSLSDPSWLNRVNQNNVHRLNRLITADSGEDEVTTDGLFSAWAAVTDGETLFIAMRVIDESIVLDSGIEWWKDDTVELFIDGDNSKQTGNFDGENDYHLSFRVEDQRLRTGGRSLQAPSNLVYELSANGFDMDIINGLYTPDLQQDGNVDVGFNLEIAIPLDELDIEAGVPFGINVHYNDDDNGGDRDAKYTWVGQFGIDRDFIEPAGLATALIDE